MIAGPFFLAALPAADHFTMRLKAAVVEHATGFSLVALWRISVHPLWCERGKRHKAQQSSLPEGALP